MWIALATLYGNKGIDAHACQISQCLLVDTQMFATLLDDCSYLLLVHNYQYIVISVQR